MKRVIAFILLAVMLLSFVSCWKEEQPDRHFKDPTDNVTDTDGDDGDASTDSQPEDSKNTVETPKVPFEDLIQPEE